jgi:dolichol-phosphate mannosyltransferase
MNNHVVLIPTYNEAESIGILLKDLLALDVDIIVIDDDSPDKTAQIVQSFESNRLQLIQHGTKNGIGPAYIVGIQAALNRGYEKIATMDADGSHLVSDLAPMFLESLSCDVVVGSRWIPGGQVTNWPTHRVLLSKLGTWYARKCLNLPFKDLTGGLRIYDAKLLHKLNFAAIRSNGYCFQIEMIRALASINARIKEMPIHFIERSNGKSKMSRSIVVEALIKVSVWGFSRLFRVNADKLHYVN